MGDGAIDSRARRVRVTRPKVLFYQTCFYREIMDCMGGCIKFAWIPAIIALFLATLSLVNNAAWNAQNQPSKYPSRYHVLEEAHFPDPRRTLRYSLILKIIFFFNVQINF